MNHADVILTGAVTSWNGRILSPLVVMAVALLFNQLVVRRVTTHMDRRSYRELDRVVRAQPCGTVLITPDGEQALMIERRYRLGLVCTWKVERVPTAAWDAAVSDFTCGQSHSTISLTTFGFAEQTITMAQGAVAVAPDPFGNPDPLPPGPHAAGRLNRAAETVRRARFHVRTGVLRPSPTDIAELIGQLRTARPRAGGCRVGSADRV